MSKMRSVRMIALVALMATTVPACGKSTSRVAITTTNDPPIAIIAGPPKYDTGDKYMWFEHDVFAENSGDRPISVNYQTSATYLGNNQLVVAEDGCGPGTPYPGETLPSLPCTLKAHMPYILAPHTSTKVTTVRVYVGIKGMQPTKDGIYEWNKDVMWYFADTEENHTAHVKLIYVRK